MKRENTKISKQKVWQLALVYPTLCNIAITIAIEYFNIIIVQSIV